MQALLQLDSAAFQYAGRPTSVGPFDLAVQPGDLQLVSGPSGSGKSTLARLACGLIPHLYRGHVRGRTLLGGRPMGDLPLWQIAGRVGFVGQNPAAQVLAASARGEIGFGLDTLGLSAADIDARVQCMVDEFDLTELADRDPQTLSGGEQQRLVLAAVAARHPEVVVLDEPLSMLDPHAAAAVVAQLDRLRRHGAAIVACEHRIDALAARPDVRHTTLPARPAPDVPVIDLPARVSAFRVVVEQLAVTLGGRPVLSGVDLDLAGGEVVGIAGPNGAGKTTLLRALSGLQPHTGRIVRLGSGMPHPPQLGMCFQNPDRQFFNPTVRQELCFGRATVDAAYYRAVLDLLGLTPYENVPPLLLSEGEKKRLGLGVMLLSPGLAGVCLDEPTLGQDARHRKHLGGVVRGLANAGLLCVVASHDLPWLGEWVDRLVVLDGGRVVTDAPVASGRGPSSDAWDRMSALAAPAGTV